LFVFKFLNKKHRPDEQLKLRIGIHSGSVVAGVQADEGNSRQGARLSACATWRSRNEGQGQANDLLAQRL
uniref:Guanylate cyclase domain-containing protein n=1 Tax=Parascaris equorum TaxID=6256 RepID=A0A914RTS2_PAREQ